MMEDSKSAKMRKLAERVGIPIYEDLLSLPSLPRELLKKVPYAFVKKHRLLPILDEETTVTVASSNPFLIEPLEDLRTLIEKNVIAVFAPEEVIDIAIHEIYNKEQKAASEGIQELVSKEGIFEGSEKEIYDLLDDPKHLAPIIRVLNLILLEAIQQGASDIHFEPYEGALRIRYRIDGVLQNRHAPAPEFQLSLITRLKVMAKLDIAEHRLPQDGRIKLRMGRREIDFRVSTVPVHGGERVVLRILDKGNVIVGLDKLGMGEETLRAFRRQIAVTEGIVLVTGPTGSGKTTTLYSAISERASDEVNIMTIEDPVEYHFEGIAQIGVQPKIGLDFPRGLRHILRQDPDIILIGEIRDRETAEIAIQASLTGHLVLSTLHTNDAPSAITRLVDMGIESYLLSSSIIGVLAQRLVRKICPECGQDREASLEEKQVLGEKGIFFVKEGKGCSACYGTGYKGRHGIYELMKVTAAIQKQIVESADAIQMRKVAIDSGMKTLLEGGLALVRRGITTYQEVLRVTRAIGD
jgi:general secretion pathway protein E